MDALNFPDGVYLVDFEFHPARGREGNPPVPVCMVVREWPSGRTSRYWQDDLEPMATAHLSRRAIRHCASPITPLPRWIVSVCWAGRHRTMCSTSLPSSAA